MIHGRVDLFGPGSNAAFQIDELAKVKLLFEIFAHSF